VTTHTYAVTKGLVDDNGFAPRYLKLDPKAITNDVIGSYMNIKNSSKPNLELHYKEWSTSPN